MHPAATDTLTCDTARLARWWTDPAYDYERALHAAEGTWWDRLRSWLDWKLSEWFNWTLTDSEVNWVFVVAALVVGDEAEALGLVEPLDSTVIHNNGTSCKKFRAK